MNYREDLADVRRKQNPDGLKAGGQPFRVLVVDDSTVMRKIVTRHLMSQAYHICGEAANGLQAVQLYKELDPDVVTLDINMPRLNGDEALKQILAYDSGAKIVMLTSEGQKETVMDAMCAGAKGFIVKPPEKKTVCGKVKEALEA